MKTKQLKSLVISCALALILLLMTIQFVSASADPGRAEQPVAAAPLPSSAESGRAVPLQQPGNLTATLQVASGAKIDFDPGNNNPARRLWTQTQCSHFLYRIQ